jgi:dihydrofolate synthase/folylpolyglutamate synthase
VSDLAVPEGRIGTIIERLYALYPKLIDLSLGRLQRLLAALDHPELKLPPVLHVAGTNGKGSTCAFARAIGEAAGMRVHVTTSPHLVRINERFRVAGELVGDDELLRTLERVEGANGSEPITVFEVLIAVAFVLFAEHPAELCILEVGLGGRGDATNVIERPAACAITSISLDHREFLGDTIEKIAAEKAGIIKPGVPVAVGAQPPGVRGVFLARASELGAPVVLRDRDWTIGRLADRLRFSDAGGTLDLPFPSLPGAHQYDNAGIAIAALRASGLPIPDAAFAAGMARAEWPARMQRLRGRLARTLPPDWELWLDGGHNPGAGVVLAEHLHAWRDEPIHLVVGMKSTKDAAEFLRPLLPLAASVWAIAEPHQHLALPVDAVVAASGGVARPGPTAAAALAHIAAEFERPGRVLICGSLYLAGEILKADGP